jgi:predicted ATP-grasp superfamily ATP-dependent carboligase
VDAIVADAQLFNAVAGLRGLGRAGVRVVALGPRRGAAGRWSRYAAGRAVGGIAAAAAEHGPAVVYPAQERTVDELLVLSDAPGVVLPWDPVTLPALREKGRLPELVAGHGLRTPATHFDGMATELAAAGVPLPAILKPAAPGGTGALKTARFVASRSELEALAAELAPDVRVIVQERVEGRLQSLALVLDRGGRLVACFQEQVLRTWPAAAGTFAATVSVEPDEDLVERARAMVAAAGYWGLVQFDLIATDGGPVLLDANPRFYLCMPLALACGVNLPAAWHAVVTGADPGEPGPYPAGRTYRELEGDLYAARHGHASRLISRRRVDAGAIWAADDPLASALLAADLVAWPLRRRLGRRR